MAAATLVGEHEHLDDPVTRRVGELALHDLERGNGPEHAGLEREPGERVAERDRPGRRPTPRGRA